MTEEEIVQQYGLTFQDAETIGPAVQSYLRLAERLGCEVIHVASTHLRDGLLSDLAHHDTWTQEFRNQIIRSAINLGRKFGFDEKTCQASRHVGEKSSSVICRPNISSTSEWSFFCIWRLCVRNRTLRQSSQQSQARHVLDSQQRDIWIVIP